MTLRTSLSLRRRKSPVPPVFPTTTDPHDMAHLPILPAPSTPSASDSSTSIPDSRSLLLHLSLLELFHAHKLSLLSSAPLRLLLSPTAADSDDAVFLSYLELAALRFELWWRAITPLVSTPSPALPAARLPPLDVLMIWHAYLLNPRRYIDDCTRQNATHMLALPFPWESLAPLLDLDTLTYRLPAAAAAWWTSLTAGAEPVDLLAQLAAGTRAPEIPVSCPACSATHRVHVATWGAADWSFTCPCGAELSHEALRRACITADLAALRSDPAAMMRGTAAPPLAGTSDLNTRLRALVADAPDALALVDEHLHAFYPPPSSTSHAVSPATSACLSLASAAHRQASFVGKMHHHLWLRAPSAAGTVARARTRYGRFFELFAAHRGHTLVPTLDVDLAWHTHQLHPAAYRDYCLAAAKRFIDHDDQLPTGTLDTGFEDTERWFEERFGREYGGCFCWVCEGVRDDEDAAEAAEGGLAGLRRKMGGIVGVGRKRREWERGVGIEFWRAVERRRAEGGMAVRRWREEAGAGREKGEGGEGGEGGETAQKQGPRKEGLSLHGLAQVLNAGPQS
ncbi:hypothetical protein EDC01DRAFT_188398 [Geopyxis carbonaria]|nr:hypothetical protein EDC01DRAFT_188398 [Geopyxis carbonaria]